MKNSKPNAPIIFLTGISCTGKSTVYKHFKRNNQPHSYLEIHDIDEDGVPPVGRKHWKLFRMELLLNQAIKNRKNGKATIICGIVLPFEVISSELYSEKENINFILLTISTKEFDKRMKKRLKIIKEEWRWNKVKKSNKELAPTLLKQFFNLKNGYVINTEKMSTLEMINRIKEVLLKLDYRTRY